MEEPLGEMDNQWLKAKVREILSKEFQPFKTQERAWESLKGTPLFENMERGLFNHYWTDIRGWPRTNLRPARLRRLK